MKAIRIHETGDVSVLKLEDIDMPKPGAGEVRVRVRAAGVNPVDTYIRSGNYALPPLPFTPGSDGAGEIDAVGEAITAWKPGDRVYLGLKNSGSYAEYAVASANAVYALPDNVSYAQGASIGVPYSTAYCALVFKGQAKHNDAVLVHGASGGVGLAALQIGRALGLRMLGTAGSEEGLDLVGDQGAEAFDHHALDYLNDIVGFNCGRGPDVILEMLANVNLPKDLDIIGSGGRIVVIGSRGEVTIDPRLLMRKQSSIHGMMFANSTPEELTEAHGFLYQHLQSGELEPIVRVELPLSEAPRAHELVLEPGASGKIILTP